MHRFPGASAPPEPATAEGDEAATHERREQTPTSTRHSRVKSNSTGLVIAAFVLALVVRLAFLCTSHGNYDVYTGNYDTARYEEAVAALTGKGQLYRDTEKYNYSPVWALMLAGMSGIGKMLGVPLHSVIGALLLLTDLLTAAVLLRLSGRKAALLFFLNPVSIMASCHHVMFDNIAILFLLSGLASTSRPTGWLTASVVVKHVTGFHSLLLLRGWRMLVPAGVFLASFLPFWSVRESVIERVFRYRSTPEEYGLVNLLRVGVPQSALSLMFFAAVITAVVLLRKVEAKRASLLLFLVMLVFLPGVAEYYFVWPIALGSIFGGAGYYVFSAVATLFFAGSLDGLNLQTQFRHLP
jgi:hypothetical protein